MISKNRTIRKILVSVSVLGLLCGCQRVNRRYEPPEKLPQARTEEPETAQQPGDDIQILREALMEIVEEAPRLTADGTPGSDNEFISIYYENLETGDRLSLYPARYYPCSMVKLVCMVAVYDGIEEGKIREKDVQDMLEAMITISDNTSYNVLAQMAGQQRISDILKRAGTRDTVVNHGLLPGDAYFDGDPGLPDNRSTAEDMGKVLRLIYDWPDEENREKMLDLLLACEDDTALRQGLPAQDSVAHKSGWAEGLYHDGAIVMEPGGGSYILVMMTENAGQEEFASVSQAVTAYREGTLAVTEAG